MKKIILAFVFTLLLTVGLPLTSSAESGQAANGFYKLEGATKYVPLVTFITGSMNFKKSILMDEDYYLIMDGEAVAAYEILNSKTDEELDRKWMTETELKRMFDVEIDSNGKITIGGFVDDKDFRVLSID